MIRPEARPIVVSEGDITGHFLVASHEADRIRIQSEAVDDDTFRYTVTGEIALERKAISAIMATPMGQPDAQWEEVRDGLRDVGYPNRKVKALARGALASDLRVVGPASRQLAGQLTDNQDQKTQTANIPVFSYFESYDYTASEMRKHMASKKLLSYLKGIGIDPIVAQRLQELTTHDSTFPNEAHTLQQIVGFDDGELLEVFNRVILDTVDPAIEAELIARLQEASFKGFRQQAYFTDSHLEGGGRGYEVYLRSQDIPVSVIGRLDATKVSIGALLRDTDRRTGRDRRKVSFSVQTPRVVAHPQIVWETRGNKRTFKFPVNGYSQEHPYGENRLVRPSSVLGAALVINYLAGLKGIDHKAELDARKRKLKRIHRSHAEQSGLHEAGLLPLFMTHRESELLDDPYFSAVEDAVR